MKGPVAARGNYRDLRAGIPFVAALAFALSACASDERPIADGTAGAPQSGIASFAPAPGSQGALRVVQTLPAPANPNGGAIQLVAPGDVLEIDVFRVDELDRAVQVDASGRISLPLIGVVPAAGRTIQALEIEIEALYGTRYLQNPEIVLFMKESAGQRVTVDGEVARAGIYPVTARSSLQQVLAQAGGFRAIGDPSRVYVFRNIGEERLVASYDVGAIRAGRRTDPPIIGGDTVVVFSSSAKVALQTLKEAIGVARGAAIVVP